MTPQEVTRESLRILADKLKAVPPIDAIGMTPGMLDRVMAIKPDEAGRIKIADIRKALRGG
jgi:hypothetical protein